MIWSNREEKEKTEGAAGAYFIIFSKLSQQISITAYEFPVKTLAGCSAKTQKSLMNDQYMFPEAAELAEQV